MVEFSRFRASSAPILSWSCKTCLFCMCTSSRLCIYIFSLFVYTILFRNILIVIGGGIRFKLLFGCKSQPNNLTWLIKDDIDAVNAYRTYTHLCLVLVITTQHFVHVPRTFICLVEFNVLTVIAVSNFVVKSTCECT